MGVVVSQDPKNFSLINATMLLLVHYSLLMRTKYFVWYKAEPVLAVLKRLSVLVLVLVCMKLSIQNVQADDNHKETSLPEVTIMASPFGNHSELDMAQPVSVLEGDRLRYKQETSLGDTLSGELGVASSSFGPGAGRPLIRGLDGPRIMILENGIDTLDVSSLSADHAVTAESINASKIEILRGPSTLMYGGGAIGGVVNVVTDKIPRRIFKKLTGTFGARGNTSTQEKSGSFNASGSIGNHISLNASGFRRKTNDYGIPGNQNRNEPDHGKRGKVKNSDTNSGGGSIGGSILGSRGYIGGSLSRSESKYGVPSEEAPRIDLVKNRYDIAGELNRPVIGFEKLKVKMGYSDYRHSEFESSGELGSVFKNQGIDSRAELTHRPVKGFKGVIGVQVKDRDFSAIGEETIVPKTNSRNTSVFLIEERHWNNFHLDVGGRYEHASVDPKSANDSRKYDLYGVSIGGKWKPVDGYSIGLTGTRGQRAPATEELYTSGAHHATETFQTGSQRLKKETSNNLDFTLSKTSGGIRWQTNFFYNYYENYIYWANADADSNGIADRVDEEGAADPDGELLVQNVTQGGATFYGVEAEVKFIFKPKVLDLRLFTDYVRARLNHNGGNVPRTTPQRFGLEWNHRSGPWKLNLMTTHVLKQNKVAAAETSTRGYTMINLTAGYTMKMNRSTKLTVFLQGKNLMNEDVRLHTSYLKAFAPRPGRALLIGVRGQF